MEVTKETIMGDLLAHDMGVAMVLMEAGMHCVGCPSSIGESLEDACMVHSIDVDELVVNINKFFAEQK